jgi:hypothetical protein
MDWSERAMIRTSKFHTYCGEGWPSLEFMKPHFFGTPGREWQLQGGDEACLKLEGIFGTSHQDGIGRRVDLTLLMDGFPGMGVALTYYTFGGGDPGGVEHVYYCSRGDMSRIEEYERCMDADVVSRSLIIPFAKAWPAVEEFVLTGGELPKSIDWVASKGLPPEAFPYQHEVDRDGNLIREERFALKGK